MPIMWISIRYGQAGNMIAHIRLASVGRLNYSNTHPFLKWDNQGGCWTLAHNGTLFNEKLTGCLTEEQEGQTDSERILLCIIAAVNRQQDELGRRLTPDERFVLLDDLITDLFVGNKLNLLVWDGEYMYVHSNYANSLYEGRLSFESVLFSTHPLSSIGTELWQPLPFLRLLVFKDGKLVYEG